MKLTAKSSEVFDYVKSNGGHVSIDEICNAIGRASRSVGANVTDLQKKGLVEREKVEVAEHFLFIIRHFNLTGGFAFVQRLEYASQ